jgi:Spy/CpxP family protein refolding chaperone
LRQNAQWNRKKHNNNPVKYMKSMKSMMVAALVVGSLIACNAQPAGGAPGGGAPGAGAPGGGGRRGGAPMTTDGLITTFQTALGDANKLTEAELPKVKTVLDDMIKKQADLRADQSVAQADRATKRTAIITEASAALKAILTPAQFAIVEPLLQQAGRGGRGGRRGAGGAGGAGAPPPAPAAQ